MGMWNGTATFLIQLTILLKSYAYAHNMTWPFKSLVLLKRTESVYQDKNFYTNIYKRIICNSLKLGKA